MIWLIVLALIGGVFLGWFFAPSVDQLFDWREKLNERLKRE